MFLRLIYLKNSTFPSLKITVDLLIDVRSEASKHHFFTPTMRVFQSISGHSSELSIANNSSWPTVSQLNVSPTLYQTDLRITSHRNQKFPPSQIFIQNSNQMAFRLTATTSFPRVFSQLLQCFTQRPSVSAHRAALITKIDLTFPAFCLKFVDLAVQFCFRCKFLFHKERYSSCSSQV